MLSAASIYAFLKYVNDERLSSLVFYALATILMLYSETIGLLVVLFQWIAIYFIYKKLNLKWFVCQVMIFLLYIPWLIVFFGDLSGMLSSNFPSQNIMGGVVAKIAYIFFSFSLGQTISPFNYFITVPLLSFFAVLFVMSIILGIKNNKTATIFLLMYGGVLLIQAFTGINAPHYLMAACVPYYILLSMGISNIGNKKLRFILIGLILVIWAYSLFNLYTNQQYHRMEFTDDWRGVVKYVKDKTRNNSLILYSHESFKYYFGDRGDGVDYLSQNESSMKKRIKEFMGIKKNNKIIFVFSPLSGIFKDKIEKGRQLYLWMSKNYKLKYEKRFNEDKEAKLKRRFVDRLFPEYRVIAGIFVNRRNILNK